MVLKNLLVDFKIIMPVEYSMNGGYVKVREYLYTWIIIWVNVIVDNIIDTSMVLPRYKGYCMVYKPDWYKKEEYHQIPTPYRYWKKKWNPHYRYPYGISLLLNRTIPGQHWSQVTTNIGPNACECTISRPNINNGMKKPT